MYIYRLEEVLSNDDTNNPCERANADFFNKIGYMFRYFRDTFVWAVGFLCFLEVVAPVDHFVAYFKENGKN